MTALALGYFDLPGLPQQLDCVAVETVARGLERLTELTSTRSALLGISRGAELALLASSIYPHLVRRTAAVVPSLYLWPGLATPTAAAWTMAGQPLPFIPDEPEAAAAEVALVNHSTDPAAPYMEAALAMATGVQREAARIRLEDITAPVLLVSGAADALWPSAAQCLTAIEELADDRYQHLSYAGAGHRLSAFPATPMSTSMTTADGFHLQLGGSVQATAAASADLWARLPTWLKAGD
jgi:pimeloyl-ACP methyl ester carboxylesterase